jgi:hypothetical protein
MTKYIDHIFDLFSKNYIYIVVLTYVLYISFFIGILSINPKYLRIFSSIVQFCLGVFLIFRFNPFRNHYELKEGDARVISSSGLFLLVNLGATEFAIQYDYIKEKLKDWNIISQNT